MHSINFLTPKNVEYCFDEINNDDYQFIQLFDLTYCLLYYSGSRQIITIYSVSNLTDIQKQSIDEYIPNRYPNRDPEISIQYTWNPMLNVNDGFKHKYYSGIWVVAWCIDILIRNSNSNSRLLTDKKSSFRLVLKFYK